MEVASRFFTGLLTFRIQPYLGSGIAQPVDDVGDELEDSRFESHWGQVIFLFSKAFRQVRGLTQPPIEWGLEWGGGDFAGVKCPSSAENKDIWTLKYEGTIIETLGVIHLYTTPSFVRIHVPSRNTAVRATISHTVMKVMVP